MENYGEMRIRSGLHQHHVPRRAALETGPPGPRGAGPAAHSSPVPSLELFQSPPKASCRHASRTSISSGSKAMALGPWPRPGRRTPEIVYGITGLGAWGDFRGFACIVIPGLTMARL